MRSVFLAGAVAALVLVPVPGVVGAAWAGGADEAATAAQIDAIIDSGLRHSQAMRDAGELFDVIGPRLTGSQNLVKAQDWVMARFARYGLKDIHRESYPFGTAWNLDSWHARMIAPRGLDMRSIPVAWSPSTQGSISGPVVLAPITAPDQFDAWRRDNAGKLAGKIVLISLPGSGSEPDKAAFHRLDASDIARRDVYALPSDDQEPYIKFAERAHFTRTFSQALKAEGALAMVRISARDGGLVHGEGYNFAAGEGLALPFMELGAEDYRRLARLTMLGAAPQVELAIAAHGAPGMTEASNVLAQIPGTDPKAGFVMAGAHFDSWIAGDGASDNGAGSIVVLEAARILATMPRPRRTIRFALWSGEEQGLLGSLAYIERHFASRPLPGSVTGIDRFVKWNAAWPITAKPEYAEMKAYFNLDNGSGKIRGIYAEDNVAAQPLLKKWLSPFASMGAGNVVTGRTGGTDHVFMQAIGLPGFQFIQDPLDYGSRVHHSNLDTVDHMKSDDMRQAATIMAAMLWQAANSPDELPRGPLPGEPTKADPFAVKDPADR